MMLPNTNGEPTMTNYTFAPLPYPADALEPVIDKTTMEIHHGRHHKAYFDNFIAAIQDTPLANETLETIFAGISKHSPAVRNNGGGYYNHNLYWNVMSPNGGGAPEGELLDAINAAFSSFDACKTAFKDAGIKQFGSGWSAPSARGRTCCAPPWAGRAPACCPPWSVTGIALGP